MTDTSASVPPAPDDGTEGDPRIRVAVAYHSGSGHTRVLAEAVAGGASDAGAQTALVGVDTITDEQWSWLDSADAIVFGAPTYMGTASAAFHRFAQDSAGRWARRAWCDKLAAGFTVAGAMSGEKLQTLQYFTILASQHGMHWVSLDLKPGWCTVSGSANELNRLGITLGAGAQVNTDEGPEAVSRSDRDTARHLGRRIARTASLFPAAPPPGIVTSRRGATPPPAAQPVSTR